MPKPYSGPFNPPPAHLLEDAIGWHFKKNLVHVDGFAGRWEPSAWVIFYSDHMICVDYQTLDVYRDSVVFAP